MSNLFTARLTQHDTRLTKTEFIIAARQFVLLPPLKNIAGDILEFKCGCEIQLCDHSKCTNKESKLDAAGNHGLVCHPGVKAMRATLLEKDLEKSFRFAGGNFCETASHVQLSGRTLLERRFVEFVSWQTSQAEAEERKEVGDEVSRYCKQVFLEVIFGQLNLGCCVRSFLHQVWQAEKMAMVAFVLI